MTQHGTKTKYRNSPQPVRGNQGEPTIGPTSPAREARSSDRLAPPSTDHGMLPSLKWSFADCHNRLQPEEHAPLHREHARDEAAYLELWQSNHFAHVSLAQWLAFTPFELVRAHLNIHKSVLSKVSTQRRRW